MSDTLLQTARARLRLLGGFELRTGDGAPVDISSRRARGLVAYLALTPNKTALRERICGLLWSDRAEAQARASLRQCLFELRDNLSAAGLDMLEVGRERLALRPECLISDLVELERAIANPDPTSIASLPGLLAGGRLLEGVELGGLFQDWVEQMRGQCEQTLARNIQDLLGRLDADGRWTEIAVVADAFLQRDPLHEGVIAAAIRADAANGNPAAAHRRFQNLKAALAKEYGALPGAAACEAIAAVTLRTNRDATTPTDPAPGGLALAVLAFDNLSGDVEMDYFSDGVSDEILQTVSKTSDLRVIARSSSFQFRGAAKAIDKVAAQLNVTHILDGSVRRGGSKVRISAQLVSCATRETLWSARFDRELRDVFALQDEIAEAVASALKVAFAPSPTIEPIEPIAYELFLRARSLEVEQKAGAERIKLLEQVVERAPHFAAAWAALCQARVAQARHGPRPAPFATLKAGALLAADKALTLDPNSGAAYASLSRLQPWGRYAEREALLRKALSLAADDPATLALMGGFCNHMGRIEEALGYLRRAYELDPLYPLTADIYGAVLSAAHHPNVAAFYESWRLRWPEHLTFALGPMNLAMFQGDWDRFDELAPTTNPVGAGDPSLAATLSIAQAIRDDDPELRPRMTRRLQRSIDQTGAVPLHLVATVSALGMIDEAFAAIEKASYAFMFEEDGTEPASIYNPGIIFDAHYCGGIMRDVRFVGLCAKLGLCSYWVATDRWPDCAETLSAYYDFKGEVRRRADASF